MSARASARLTAQAQAPYTLLPVRKSVAALACTALLLTLLQLPWQHVHTQGHDQPHARATLVHIHQWTAAQGTVWRSEGPDDDARSIDGLRATARDASWSFDVSLTASTSLPLPEWRPADAPAAVFHGHDPPLRGTLGSRAPPA